MAEYDCKRISARKAVKQGLMVMSFSQNSMLPGQRRMLLLVVRLLVFLWDVVPVAVSTGEQINLVALIENPIESLYGN